LSSSGKAGSATPMTRLAGVPLSATGLSARTSGPRSKLSDGSDGCGAWAVSPPLASVALPQSRLPYGLAPANAAATASICGDSKTGSRLRFLISRMNRPGR